MDTRVHAVLPFVILCKRLVKRGSILGVFLLLGTGHDQRELNLSRTRSKAYTEEESAVPVQAHRYSPELSFRNSPRVLRFSLRSIPVETPQLTNWQLVRK